MAKLNAIKLERLEDLPLYFRKIYFNKISNIEFEKKLFKISKPIQSEMMRHYNPSSKISKMVDYSKNKQSNNE